MGAVTTGNLLTVSDLCVRYALPGRGLRRRFTQAVSNVSFDLPRGRTLGVVGPSGSGKSSLARAILRLSPQAHVTGRAHFDGDDIFAASGRCLRQLRRRMQVVFQDPLTQLNPRMTVGNVISEPLNVHRIVPRRLRGKRIGELLARVHLPAELIDRLPHELSGGQRQRVAIARALACEPELIILDEPVSALDVSVQAHILNLLKDLQEQSHLSTIFIGHDLSVVSHMADEIAVLRDGCLRPSPSVKPEIPNPKS